MGISFNEYLDYHKKLAESNVDIAHQEKHRHSFFSTDVGEFEQMVQGKSGSVGDVVLHLMTLRGSLSGDEDFQRETISGGFTLLVKCNWDDRNYREQEDKWNQSKEIGLQVISKINEDSLNQCAEFPLDCFDVSAVRFAQIGPVMNDFIGWEFTYPVSSRNSITYDSSKWH